jgi:hypothetical protein
MREGAARVASSLSSVAVPLLLEYATGAERAVVLGALPAPVRESVDDWERMYRHLTDALPAEGR